MPAVIYMVVHLIGSAKYPNAYMASEAFVVSHCYFTRVSIMRMHKSFAHSLEDATILHEAIRVLALVPLHPLPLHGRLAPGGE